MKDVIEYRELFPNLQKQTWLNHASISPISTRVQSKIEEFTQIRQSGSIDNFAENLTKLEQFRTQVGKLINSGEDRIALTHNTSEGFILLASGLEWKKGDRVLLNDIEFPANVYPFLQLKKQGVEIDFVKSKNGRILVEDLEKAITPRTKILSISFVNFRYGFRPDLEKIGELCRTKGVIFSVDGIQGIGAVPIDVKKCKIDFLSCACHKWLMSLQGTAFIYLTKELQEKIHSPLTGWLSVKHFWDFFNYDENNLFDSARRFEFGTYNFMGVWAALESISILNEFRIENIWERLRFFAKMLREGITAKGYEVMSPCETLSETSGITSFQAKNGEEILKRCQEAKMTIVMREDFLRVSPHFYNTEEEIQKLLSLI